MSAMNRLNQGLWRTLWATWLLSFTPYASSFSPYFL